MAMDTPLILLANPGSASRKYALYAAGRPMARLHFEYLETGIVCTLEHAGKERVVAVNVADLTEAPRRVIPLLQAQALLQPDDTITRIGLRVVAPSGFFLQDRLLDNEVIHRLKELEPRAPLHIGSTLEELDALRREFPDTPIVGLSDSAFHSTKPDYAWNYGLPLGDADQFDIKRFGYHGLSVASAIQSLAREDRPHPRLIVTHLGSGASVTAVLDGKSQDTTMGYSPLEGLIMGTRSGSIDPTAVRALKDSLDLDDDAIEEYLNNQSGLLGLGGSADVRELLKREEAGDHQAALALQTYVYTIQKAIGQMVAVLQGADAIIFTGTIGERSAPVRGRVAAALGYLDFKLDQTANDACLNPMSLTPIHQTGSSKPIFVIPTREEAYMATRLAEMF